MIRPELSYNVGLGSASTRNDADYPRLDSPQLSGDDIAEDLPKGRAKVTAIGQLLPHLQPW